MKNFWICKRIFWQRSWTCIKAWACVSAHNWNWLHYRFCSKWKMLHWQKWQAKIIKQEKEWKCSLQNRVMSWTRHPPLLHLHIPSSPHWVCRCFCWATRPGKTIPVMLCHWLCLFCHRCLPFKGATLLRLRC